MQDRIRYHNNPEHLDYLFDPEFQRVVSSLAKVAGETAVVDVFPDAVLKTNRIPTGVAVTAPKKTALLFPQLLRDPGCGFLCFTVDWNEMPASDWQHQAGQLLNEKLIINTNNQELKAYQLLNTGLKNILTQGLYSLEVAAEDLRCFDQRSFSVLDDTINLSSAETEILNNDFLTLTNTIELRKIYSSNFVNEAPKQFFGFVHCGSQKFPEILAKRFIKPIYDFALSDLRFSSAEIDAGLYAVPYYSEVGQNYVDWINAAMNYALVNRYGIFTEIKYLLEKHFPCKVVMQHDALHAGLFVAQDQIIQTRGTQLLKENSRALIAGQRESIAAYVKTKAAGFLPHGTGEQNQSIIDYLHHFTNQQRDFYLNRAKETFYNTIPNFESCIPHTFNLKQNLNWLFEQELITSLQLLAPLINLQSRWLQGFKNSLN